MKFDELGSVWKERDDHSLSPEAREALIARACRRVERLGGTIVRRDVVETLAALAVIILFGSYAFAAPAEHVVSRTGAGFLVCWAGFIIWKLHRARTVQRPASLDAPVREFCHIEIARLDRQVRLLRTVLWWYIGPCIVGVNIMFVGMAGFGAASLAYGLATALLAWGLYALNLRAVTKELVPARNELAGLLRQLDDADFVEQPVEPAPKRPGLGSLVVLLLMLAALGWAAVKTVHRADDAYPKRAPFTAVRWDGSKPLVRIGQEWFTLVSIDGVAAEDIVAFSRWTYVDRWRKRFEEDLVEVLTRMGHPPGDNVRLVVSPPGSRATRTLENVPMTERNRRAIYDAATARDRGEQRSGNAR